MRPTFWGKKMQIITTERVPIKIWSEDPEPGAVEQLRMVARLPFVFHHVAAMPDVHWGMGSTVGSVIATKGAISPSCLGVDIACGMMAWSTGIPSSQLRPKAASIRKTIEAVVPVGFNAHREQLVESTIWSGWKDLSNDWAMAVTPDLQQKARVQHGTLGGGNHFIELCEDEHGMAWVMLHSGSRGIGKALADIHLKKAKDLCAKFFVTLPHPDLAYLPEGTEEFNDYVQAVDWCQRYAWINRELMMLLVSRVLHININPDSVVHCHHNYMVKESHFGENVWVTRKGAVCAREGMRGIIPGSMGSRSYIVEGLGNPQSFNSCSHGAGRRMGRNEARKTFTVKDLVEQTEGVECRKDQGVLDELPGAYKDIDRVMSDQVDLVKPIHELKQFLCIKG